MLDINKNETIKKLQKKLEEEKLLWQQIESAQEGKEFTLKQLEINVSKFMNQIKEETIFIQQLKEEKMFVDSSPDHKPHGIYFLLFYFLFYFFYFLI